MIQPNDDPTTLFPRHFDIPTNEAFLSTQLSLLTSRPILRRTLSSFFPGMKITEKKIRKLKSCLTVKRIPLNNLVSVKLKWRTSPNGVEKLLQTYINSYKSWYEENILNDAEKQSFFLSQAIQDRKRELEATENTLEGLYAKHHLSSFSIAELHSQLLKSISFSEEELQKERDHLNNLQTEKKSIMRVMRTEAGIDLNPILNNKRVIELRDDLQVSLSEFLTFKKKHAEDAAAIRNRQIAAKDLQSKFTDAVEMSLFGNRKQLANVKRIKEKRGYPFRWPCGISWL